VATLTDVEEIARRYLRDFPKFFQSTFNVVGRTYELGQVNVDANSLWVALFNGTTTTELTAGTNYVLDERNGILRLNSLPSGSNTIMVEGYFYEWVTPDDLSFYAQRAVEKHIRNIGVSIEEMSDLLVNAIGIATITECLWALMTEYSRDIDVITSESVHIPASQRFRMVQSLLAQWEEEYKRHATALNIGIDRVEVFSLRRTSRITNRLVPLYKPKEFGDYSPLERLWPDIDSGVIDRETQEDNLREDVYVDTTPRSGQTTNTYY
jgi:hypothetical protein